MSILRKAVSGLVGAAIAGAVNKAAHRAVVRQKPGFSTLQRLGLGGAARRRTPETAGEQLVALAAGIAGTALVNRLLRRRRRA